MIHLEQGVPRHTRLHGVIPIISLTALHASTPSGEDNTGTSARLWSYHRSKDDLLVQELVLALGGKRSSAGSTYVPSSNSDAGVASSTADAQEKSVAVPSNGQNQCHRDICPAQVSKPRHAFSHSHIRKHHVFSSPLTHCISITDPGPPLRPHQLLPLPFWLLPPLPGTHTPMPSPLRNCRDRGGEPGRVYGHGAQRRSVGRGSRWRFGKMIQLTESLFSGEWERHYAGGGLRGAVGWVDADFMCVLHM